MHNLEALMENMLLYDSTADVRAVAVEKKPETYVAEVKK